MNRTQLPRRTLSTLVLLVAGVTVFAQTETTRTFEPQVGQPGKDVVWVPTPQTLVEKMLDLAKVSPQDYVIDLGSGDGRTVIAAAKRGARAHGIEYDPDMVALAKSNAVKAGIADKATFAKADLFESDFSQATVISMFLLPTINMKLRPRLLDLRPGTRIVSNTFTMEDWEADETATAVSDCEGYCTAFLWVVPASVEGTWRLPEGELTLHQKFQTFSGTLKNGSSEMPISEGRLRGDHVAFAAGGVQYTGRVNGNVIEGMKAGLNTPWRATRAGG